MNLIFMGSSDLSKIAFEEFLKNNKKYKVKAAITGISKPSGRGLKKEKNSFQLFCEKLGLNTIKTNNINSDEIILKIKSLNPDIIITASYGQILSQKFLSIANFATINLHPSLLPKYRGATPVESAILNADNITGISIIYTVKKLDAGNIILQEKFEISDLDNAFYLKNKLFQKGGNLLSKALDKVIEGYEGIKQADEKASFCKKILKSNGHIDWSKKNSEIFNIYRAYHPWPGIYSFLNNKRIKITKLSIINDIEYNNLKIGQINYDKKNNFLISKSSNGYLNIEKLIPSGGREITGRDFWNSIKDRNNLILK